MRGTHVGWTGHQTDGSFERGNGKLELCTCVQRLVMCHGEGALGKSLGGQRCAKFYSNSVSSMFV